jgi:hypothetical protein
MATIDYMIASYGPYSASATGGNGFARDFLAGIAAMYSVPSKFSSLLLSRWISTTAHEFYLTNDSVSKHGNDAQIRMAVDILGLHGDYIHNSHLYLLLLWTQDSGTFPVRADPGCRQEEGWTEGFAVWLWRSGSCSAISVRGFGVRVLFGLKEGVYWGARKAALQFSTEICSIRLLVAKASIVGRHG